MGELSFDEPVPEWVELLSCEGDGTWDRLPADARIDSPTLFEGGQKATPKNGAGVHQRRQDREPAPF